MSRYTHFTQETSHAQLFILNRRFSPESRFIDDMPVAESDEDKPGIILDYDAEGNLISLEVLDASQRVTETRKIEFQTVE